MKPYRIGFVLLPDFSYFGFRVKQDLLTVL
jgi:hypothetical protein